ncbi:Transcription factor bHLH103 [Apostasia shenzhenica]|uniref:Transcription factor bHLH103 n=1 Tax=Apostasia shenzhenica TaxID=1088818 RepID=A0A2H9ZSI1_9ASPA|nr:Transcription factor bHLH103 [Apostasia shenzhenica]
MQAPAKNSQKIGDKITALQKLVSPFGKTDTASVLHEAAVSIESLHEQISQALLSENYCMSKSSEASTHDHQLSSLHERGLCMVPTSWGLMMNFVDDQEQLDCTVKESFY